MTQSRRMVLVSLVPGRIKMSIRELVSSSRPYRTSGTIGVFEDAGSQQNGNNLRHVWSDR